MLKRCFRLAAKMVALGALFATPALASGGDIDTATATVGCSSYTFKLLVEEVPLSGTYVVNFSITLTPSSGPAITVTGSTGPFQDGPTSVFSDTITNPLGPVTGNFTLSGLATLLGPGTNSTKTITFTNTSNSLSCGPPPPPPCSTPTSSKGGFNGTPINGGSFIWFNANFTASGIPSTGATIFFQSSTIQLTTSTGTQTLAVPNARITFSPTASCASTTFDTLTNTWMTTVPTSSCDEIFLTGLAFPVPGPLGPSDKVTWNGSFSANIAGTSANWKWGAAVYSAFTTNYNQLQVKPSHCATCAGFNNGDHAGTPEGVDTATGQPFQKYAIGGATGGGGGNFTGSWVGPVGVNPICMI